MSSPGIDYFRYLQTDRDYWESRAREAEAKLAKVRSVVESNAFHVHTDGFYSDGVIQLDDILEVLDGDPAGMIHTILSTHEEVDYIPVQSVIVDAEDIVLEVVHNGERNSDGTFCREYLMPGDVHSYQLEDIKLPATLIKRAPTTPRR